MASPCGSLVGQAFQVEHWSHRQNIGKHIHNHIAVFFVLCQCGRTRGLDGGKCLHHTQTPNLVVRSLRQSHRRCQRETQWVIAMGLATPWRAIHHRHTVLDSQNGAIVIKQMGVWDMFQP